MNLLSIQSINISDHKIQRLYQQQKFKQDHQTVYERLSKREKEIIHLLVTGSTVKSIADQLFISVHTVRQHKKNIKQKLGVNSLPQLTQYALAFDMI